MTITLDGILADWSPADRLDSTENGAAGYALFGRAENGAFLIALQSADIIGPNTTFWLNTDGDAETGYRVWDTTVGAEFNINFDAEGVPHLYTGADGQTFVADIEYVLSGDGKVLELKLPQDVLGGVTSMAVFADVNNSIFLPNNYSTTGYVIASEAPSSFDGLLTEWTEDQRLDAPGTGVDGYALYGRVDPENFVVALQSAQPIAPGSVFWLNTDGDTATGHQIWGWAGGAEYNVCVGSDGIARLYSGAAGQTFVADIDARIAPDGMSIEFAIPKAALGSGIEQVGVFVAINDAVHLPTNFGIGGYTLATPPVSAFDGLLTEWTAEQRLETALTQVEGYELYGAIKDGAFVIALKSEVEIGPNTTFWLNTDGDAATGYKVWGWAVGAEFNVNFGEDGRPRLYTGAEGETLVAELDFALGPDGKTLELAIPKALLGPSVQSVALMADVNNAVHLPGDYTNAPYVIAEPTAPATPGSYKIAIVYSETTAGAYWSEMAYSQLVMAAQSQAMSAGIPFDLIGEADLTNLAKLSQYSALVFPSFRNVPANYADIAATLQTLIHDYDVSLIAAGDFMTNGANGGSLAGNAYERMQSLFGLTRTGGDSGVNVDLVANGTNDITAGYGEGNIRTYSGAATSYFGAADGHAVTVFAQQVVNGTHHDAVVATNTGARNVHFATDGMLADNNLLGQALDWVTQPNAGPKISLAMSRDSSIVATRVDMDQSQETYDVDGGIYDALLPILQQWKADYNFVGSYYVNVGLYPQDQTTDWFISGNYYRQLLAMGNEIGSHSYTHPHDTNLLLSSSITDAELDAYVLAMQGELTPDVRAALNNMTAADFMTRLQSSLAVSPLTLTDVDKAVVAASFVFQFLHSREAIEAKMGIVVGGAAVPGMPETLETARQIIQYYDYLTGGASMAGAGYPGAFGYLTPSETDKVYIAPNMSFDFTLMGWLALNAEQAIAKWISEFNELTINSDLPIVVWPWHDYGATAWDIDGNGTSSYTLAMFTSVIEAAHAKGAEFVTLADLAARISAFEKTDLSYVVNGNVITVTTTPQLPGLGTFAVNLDSLGSQKIASVTNWYAYDGDSVFLDADGGSFEIKLGTEQVDVTRIISIGARIQLLSLTGDGTNLSFTMYGEGEVKIDLAELAGYDFNIAGAQVTNRVGDIVTLKLPSLGTHTISLVREDTINRAPTEIVVSNQVVVDEVLLDRIKVADLEVLDPNIYAHLRLNTVTVSDDRFEIDPVDGALYRKAGVAFDYETEAEISVTLTASDGEFAPITKTILVQVANVNEAPTGAVIISGTAAENETLVADVSTLGDPDGIGTLSFQWQRDSGSGFVDIVGATEAQYTLSDADSNNQVRVIVSYVDAGGAAETVASAATGPIADVNNLPTGAVTITGDATENQTLVADGSAIADADGMGALSYQWQRDAGGGFVDITGATSASYTLTDADSLALVRVVASYVDARGAAESVISAATGPIIDVNNAPSGAVSVSGTPVASQVLTADTSALSDADGLGAFSYQWQRDAGDGFADISGATAASYALTSDDVASQIRVVIAYTDARGAHEEVISAATAPVTLSNSAPTGAVTITGQAVENQILTANVAALVDADGLGAFSYQWQRNTGSGFADIAGAIAKSYKLTDADALANVRVVVSYTDGKGNLETVFSAQTASVTDVLPNLVLPALIEDMTRTITAADLVGAGYSGPAFTIEALKASSGKLTANSNGTWSFTPALNDDTGVTFTYSVKTATDTKLASATLDLVGMTDVMGTSGNDILKGKATADQYHGLAGNDIMYGGAGNDIFFGGAGNDSIYGEAGNDIAFGEDGNDTFFATLNDGNDTYDGGAGTDTLNLAAITAAVTVNLKTGTATSAQTGTDKLISIENVVGGAGNDVITGSTGNNVLSGGAGNDTIRGDAGNDTIRGGAGNDLLYGDAGNDMLYGEDGNDTFYATVNDGNDTYDGGAGTDTLNFAAITAAVTVNVKTGTATSAQTGTDKLVSIENVVGGSGNDVITGSTGNNVLSGGAGNDTIRGDAGNDTIRGGAGNDRLYGDAGNDVLYGEDGDDTFYATVNDGNDTYDGGTGTDTLNLAAITAAATINLKTGTATSAQTGTDKLISIENVVGGSGNNTIIGSAAANVLTGGKGNDTIRGDAGNDTIRGGAGNDVLYGDAGNDTLYGEDGNDTFHATINDGNDTYDGGAGTDTLNFSVITAAATINLKTGTASSAQTGTDKLVSIENVVGGSGNDVITGSAGNNVLSGGKGNDTIRGDAGNDTIRGGAGNDLLYGDAGNDMVYGEDGNDTFYATLNDGNDTYDGGAGTDTLNFAAITAAATINLQTGTASSAQTGTDKLVSIENVVGGSGNDVITGSAGNNVLSGGGGNDTIRGGAGNDTIRGGAGNDRLYGDAGNDVLYGEDGNDTFYATLNDGNDTYDGGAGTDTLNFAAVTAAATINLLTGKATSAQTGTDKLVSIENVVGGSGNDIITGSNGANVLNGGNGNDRIEGLGGKDILTGGAGSDVFIFRSVAHSQVGANRDVITDFTKGADRIDLSGIDANTALAGDQAFSFSATAGAGFTGVAGQLRFLFEDAGSAAPKTVIVGDINGDKIADFSIELTGLIKLTAADFIL
ncbi:MAG: hypothetical protein ABS76_16055 [Pelagibacterium sp. SCN 64-44]|nr:MAG: hypothetical protein ABS76_16055 [Pelagibacterium sp. SCN 64-44]